MKHSFFPRFVLLVFLVLLGGCSGSEPAPAMHPPSKDDVADQEETTPGSEGENTDLVAMQAVIDQLQDLANQLQARIESLEEKTEPMSLEEDEQGLPRVVFKAVNLQVLNGLGATNGNEDAPESNEPSEVNTNGLGNLIIGYNELRDGLNELNDRTGSHNLVMGQKQNFTSVAGFVAGKFNSVMAPYATVIGGRDNIASGTHSSVSGGKSNVASGYISTVSAGKFNTASANFSSVTGGHLNVASGEGSSVVAGLNNQALGQQSSVCGGTSNTASGSSASVAGGYNNSAAMFNATVSGGAQRISAGTNYWVAGSLVETN